MSCSADVSSNAIKHLEPDVCNKVIQIANDLVEDNYDERLAIAIAVAIVQAKKWPDNDLTVDHDYHVVPHPEGWAVRCEDAKQSSFLSYSKEIARKRAIELAAYWGVNVIIHAADGTIDPFTAPSQ